MIILNKEIERRLYSELSSLTKHKELWEENIDYVGSLLENQSLKITAKALWMLGEMGLQYPDRAKPYIKNIVSFLNSADDLLRERSLNALGRIGRADFNLIKPYFGKIIDLSKDNCSNVRLSFIWASENIATNTPTVYKEHIPVFVKLLDDENNRVRMEALEMFRVLGKRKPEYVKKYIEKLTYVSENDTERVVRIHSKGAINVILSNI